MKKIYFLLFCSKQIGLGHLVQSIELAFFLKKNFEINFIINNNLFAKNLLKKNKFKFITHNISPGNTLNFDNKLFMDHILIIDVPFNKIFLKYKQKSILFSNSNKKIISNCNINVCTHVKQNNFKYNHNFIIDRKYSIFNKIYSEKNNNKECILVCLGGTDKRNILKDLIISLSKLDLFHNYNLIVFINNFYKHSPSTKELLYIKNHFNNVNYIENFSYASKYLAKAKLVITSGGNFFMNCINNKIPNISIPSSVNEEQTSHYYFNNNCTLMKFKFNLSNKIIIKKISKYLSSEFNNIGYKSFRKNIIGDHTFLKNDIIIKKVIKLL